MNSECKFLSAKKILLTIKCYLLTTVLLVGCGGDESDVMTLGQWRGASEAARDRAIMRYFPENAEHIRGCVNRMSMLPDSAEVRVVDAGRNCALGLELRERKAQAATNGKK